MELGDLAGLEVLLLSTNRLTWPIPARLGQLGNLLRLYLDNNDLSGSIPPEFGQLRELELLAVAGNSRLAVRGETASRGAEYDLGKVSADSRADGAGAAFG